MYALIRISEFKHSLLSKSHFLVEFRSPLQQESPNKVVELLSRLTSTERHIAQLVVRGLSNEAIAQELGVSRNTVRMHLRNTFSKLNITKCIEFA